MTPKNKLSMRRFILYLAIISMLGILSYYLFEAGDFAQGVMEDKARRDSFFKEKGITFDSLGTINKIPLDSMGFVIYRDYKKIKDSLQIKDSLK